MFRGNIIPNTLFTTKNAHLNIIFKLNTCQFRFDCLQPLYFQRKNIVHVDINNKFKPHFFDIFHITKKKYINI